MKNYRKLKTSVISLLVCITMILLPAIPRAQTSLAQIQEQLLNINKRYDSAEYLSFNVDMHYASDTLTVGTNPPDFKVADIKGVYTFHRKSTHYKLGDVEYMQNDSFLIGLFHDSKVMLVGKSAAGKMPAAFLPNRTVLDSMMAYLGTNYSYSMWETSTNERMIRFVALDTNAVYQKMDIVYDAATYSLSMITYRFRDNDYVPDTEESQLPGIEQVTPVLRMADFTIRFSNYRVADFSTPFFDESLYFHFDGPGTLVPAQPYREYTIYKNY